MKIPGFIDTSPVEANYYLNWVRYMLGIMGTADSLYHDESRAIRQTAKKLWRDARPWNDRTTRLVYRGVRLDAPDLDGKVLPFYQGRPGEDVAACSFSENVNIACHFADPDPVTGFGAVRELPPHGYVIEMEVQAADVLFHWSYLERYAIFRERVFAPGSEYHVGRTVLYLPEGHVDWLVQQREVTVRNHPGLIQRVKSFPDRYPNYRSPGDTYPRPNEGEGTLRRIARTLRDL